MKNTIFLYFLVAAAAITLLAGRPALGSNSPWGANYFPNVPLVTQDGETVRFFDDLIKDKIVSINFIYTSCADTCPLETAQLVRVQRLLGDRMGNDVFFYSITIDPEHDTPEVLKEYRERFGADWTFLTGNNSDIVKLRRKLGLYIEEIQDGSNNHNVNMIIGNQTTGRWMKRSPFENPYVLADQLGNWLSGWKSPPKGGDYASAPELRTITTGERLFRTRCATCHSVTGVEEEGALGPDLLGVTERRPMSWLINWLRAPDQMLAQRDPVAMALYAQYNNLAMPNMRLNRQEAMDLLDYLEQEQKRITEKKPMRIFEGAGSADAAKLAGDPVSIVNAWVREADPAARANAGYMTLVNGGAEELTLVKVESQAFERIEMHEMSMIDGLMEMREVPNLVIPAKGRATFSPGGRHLMLKSPKRYLAEGQKVELTLSFKSGESQKILFDVLSR